MEARERLTGIGSLLLPWGPRAQTWVNRLSDACFFPPVAPASLPVISFILTSPWCHTTRPIDTETCMSHVVVFLDRQQAV